MLWFLDAKAEFCKKYFCFIGVYEDKKKFFLEFLTFNQAV